MNTDLTSATDRGLSVALCTYNGELYLREQLESIAAQTRPPDELVICDDCSTDGTRSIIEDFSSEAPFPVRLSVSDRNLGSTKNFERAIELCRGDLIALSDQDDVWLRDKLELIESVFSARPEVGLVFTDAEIVDQELRPLGYRLWESEGFDQKKQGLFEAGKAFPILLLGNQVTGATMVFRSGFRDLVLPIPVIPGSGLIHDGWIALLISAVADLAFIREPLIRYRQHPGQQLGTRLRQGEKLSWRERLRRNNCSPDSVKRFSVIFDRLAAMRSRYQYKEVLYESRDQIEHLKTRAGLPENRLRRLPYILRELLTLRYHHYSNSLLSAAKDFYGPGK